MAQYDVASSEWWIARLIRDLMDRRPVLTKLERYYTGQHDLTFASQKYRAEFASRIRSFCDNFCLLVVDAERERLNIEGFRIGSDKAADTTAWDIWQANDLDARSAIAHTEALVKGICYVTVWANQDGQPQITIEDPLQVVVAEDGGERSAGLKLWLDASGYLFMTLYLPDRIEKYQSVQPVRSGLMFSVDRWTRFDNWEPRFVDGEEWPLPNALGEVPIVALVNNQRLSGDGRSELEAVIPIQNAINKTIADMLVASEFGAFRQRWATGIEIPTDENGNPIEPFKVAVDRLWIANPPEGGPEPHFGEFSQTDLAPYVQSVEMFVQHIASITKTPPHYLLGQSGTFPSGEALKATETGLVAKSRLAMRYFGEAWEEVMALAFKVLNDQRADGTLEVLWRDPESKVQSELTDAVMKEQALGVPQETLWAKLGYTPTEIARFRVQQATDQLLTPATVAVPALNVPRTGG